MKTLKIFLLLLFSLGLTFTSCETDNKDEPTNYQETINLSSAGSLSTALTTIKLSTIIDLTITGNIDSRDFKTMRDNMPSLAVIDLSGATIVAYTGTEGTNLEATSPANTIPNQALNGSIGLTSITLPASATAIGEYAFTGCRSLKSITIPSSVTTIGMYAFQDCMSLSSLTMPSSLTSIACAAFANCRSLTTLTLPEGLINIDIQAFSGCESITSLTIPSTVTFIGSNSFGGFVNLTSIYCHITNPAIFTAVDRFYSVNKTTCALYVPIGSLSLYQAEVNCKTFTYIFGM